MEAWTPEVRPYQPESACRTLIQGCPTDVEAGGFHWAWIPTGFTARLR